MEESLRSAETQGNMHVARCSQLKDAEAVPELRPEDYRAALDLESVDADSLSPLVLAYVGDAFYDLCAREYVLCHGSRQINKLNKHKTELVCAHAQSELMRHYEEAGMLTEEELAVYRRGRNAKSATHSKNSSIQDYRRATGFEALIGALYLSGRKARAVELIGAGIRWLDGIAV